MRTFGFLLKTYRERAGLSQNDLAVQAGLSTSTISRVEKGERGPLSKYKQVLALARALGLNQDDMNALLLAAGLPAGAAPELTLHPRDDTLYRIVQELETLRNDTQISPAQVRFVEETLLLVLRGARAALPQADLSAMPGGAPTARPLSEEEHYLDDLLSALLSGQASPGGMPFNVLHAAARSPHWELRRRLAEAIPALIRLDARRTLPLIQTLRDDPPDPEWRTDIRRRVIEAMPSLWAALPAEVAPLLAWRDGDEVYAGLATLDALADIGNARLTDQVRPPLLDAVQAEHRPAVTLYAGVVEQCLDRPEEAIQTILRYRSDADRLTRICMARPLYRLLPTQTAQALKMMNYVLRSEGGRPAEHQNVRRAIARAAASLAALLDGPLDELALNLLRILIADPDVHIRRAACEALPILAERFPETGLDLIQQYLLHDRDRFVHERTWNALRYLMERGSERAEELCAQMIELG